MAMHKPRHSGQIKEPRECCQPCGVGREGQETPWTSQVKLSLLFHSVLHIHRWPNFPTWAVQKSAWCAMTACICAVIFKDAFAFSLLHRRVLLWGQPVLWHTGWKLLSRGGMREEKMLQLTRLGENQEKGRVYFCRLVLISAFFPMSLE